MAFEKFNDQGSRYHGELTVTICKNCVIYFNKTVSEIMREKGIKDRIVLMFDKDNYLIGIGAPDEGDKPYKISEKKSGGLSFMSKPFMRHIDYPCEEIEYYPIEWNDEKGIFIVVPTKIKS